MSGLAEFAFRAGWQAVQWLPERVAIALFHAGADRAVRKRGKGVERLRANLRRVRPEISDAELNDLVRRGMRSYARYWMDTFRLHTYSRDEHLRRFRFDGEEELARLATSGHGAVLALPHAGNWEAAGAWVGANGWKLITVAERLKPEGVYQRFLAFRRSLGMEIIPTSGGERAPLDLLAEKVTSGYLAPLLADRDLSRRGVDVTFFGGRARMPGGPALLALRTGAPLYAVHMWYDPDGIAHGRLVGPIPVPEGGTLEERVRFLTQEIADRLAQGIAEHPEDWHMLQRVWVDEPAQAMA
ncbi:phosphatidylinositol mannoside acyltransferase [Catenuloplanes atrovinosus]|uniref:KDO2-lipid IV(A) lauroyltransferase n=1 Tax=Catenuloplanes atrovinosus TaxID=137266 RepID=A0AAE4C719_9ACTN|nr:phosphatidylinositol mannoside acyltransferase [Catenuloplanes atrovinosus]MDR7274091.1 KDO2-lipid IV(A) lauroyltransferase [Catenuloplanes atrovinosus]